MKERDLLIYLAGLLQGWSVREYPVTRKETREVMDLVLRILKETREESK